jgi:hypothetical protein
MHRHQNWFVLAWLILGAAWLALMFLLLAHGEGNPTPVAVGPATGLLLAGDVLLLFVVSLPYYMTHRANPDRPRSRHPYLQLMGEAVNWAFAILVTYSAERSVFPQLPLTLWAGIIGVLLGLLLMTTRLARTSRSTPAHRPQS